MHIVHVSAECYPVAKAGGLGDVVGALPKYLKEIDVDAWVIIPKYDVPWVEEHKFKTIFESDAYLGEKHFQYRIQKEEKDTLGFPFFVAEIKGRFDRPGIYIDPYSGYPYWDEFERNLSFQIAALDWIQSMKDKPDLIHCHDHQTGLIPFMLKKCTIYDDIKHIPTVFTIHNGQYHGSVDFGYAHLLPSFNWNDYGLLDWDGKLNSLASGIKNAWQLTTVSESYLEELRYECNGLESLIGHESQKSSGILNGIDVEVWNPANDSHIAYHYDAKTVAKGKKQNKEELCKYFDLDPALPTYSFIGRLVREKGADILPDLISNFLRTSHEANFIVLGTGDPDLHDRFLHMKNHHTGYFDTSIEYNEKLAHQIYAGTDFLLMPSRVEPCGLNQMYAMRYGSIPIVRSVGGLKDTVKDINEKNGYGFRFKGFNMPDAMEALERSYQLYNHQSKKFKSLRTKVMKLDFSWNKSAERYRELYQSINTNI
jgi:starch synthase